MVVGTGDGHWITTAPEWQKLRLIYNVIKVTGKKLHIKREKAYYTNVQISVQSSHCFLPSSPMLLARCSLGALENELSVKGGKSLRMDI